METRLANSQSSLRSADAAQAIKFTVGKIDAGVAILLTDQHHLIEFPSLLLPEGVQQGSIINFHATRNYIEESHKETSFWDLQDTLLQEFGQYVPSAPQIKATKVTHTDVVVEWAPLDLRRIRLHRIDVYKNVNRMFNHVAPHSTSVKMGGLHPGMEYEIQVVWKTSAGELTSNRITVKTKALDDMSALKVAFGTFERVWLVEELKEALKQLGVIIVEGVDHDTTHLVCELLHGPLYKAAVESNLPVVAPEWVDACVKEKKMVPCGPFYVQNKGDKSMPLS